MTSPIMEEEDWESLLNAMVRCYTFTQVKPGRGRAAMAAMFVLGLNGSCSGQLPKWWSKGWRQIQFVPFTDWPAIGEPTLENAYNDQLRHHFAKALSALEVPFGPGGFDFSDVSHDTSSLSFTHTTATRSITFTGGTSVVIMPRGAAPWQEQTRILFHWKRPLELQSVEKIWLEGQLELTGILYNSNHPALVVFTDGADFVIFQPWDCTVLYYNTFPGKPGCISGSGAVRLIAHHLLYVGSQDGSFNWRMHLQKASDLSKELAPLLAAKKRLGEVPC